MQVSSAACLLSGMDAVVAIVGTLLGAVLGTAGSYLIQSRHHRREAAERLAAMRREAYVDWLRELQRLLSSIKDSNRQHARGNLSERRLQSDLRGVKTEDAQLALERLRLLCGSAVARDAGQLWTHLRRHKVPLGQEMSSEAWAAWQEEYWNLRRAFLNFARLELGVPPLDWSVVGVGPRGDRPDRTY